MHVTSFCVDIMFSFLLSIYSSRISGSNDNSMSSTLKTFQTVFQSGCTILLSHQQCMRGPISLYFHQLLGIEYLSPTPAQLQFPSSYVEALIPAAAAAAAAAAAKSLQSCPTLCDPKDSRAPGSNIPGILQARTLEWVAISLSNAWKWKRKVKSFSRAQLSETPWTAAYQAPLAMGFSRQEYWSGVPLPSPALIPSMAIFGDSPMRRWKVKCGHGEKVKVAQSCPTLCNPMDYTVHEVL